MKDEESEWLFSAPLATLLLCGAAALFLLGYIPEMRKARECEARVEEARTRIRDLVVQQGRARQRIAELEAGDRDAVEEAVREVLRQGGKNDFLPPQ